MSDYRELVAILKELLTNRFYPKPQFIRGLLGDGNGNVIVPDRPDYNYVRFNRSSSETFEVFNKEVSQPVDGWPVLIGSFPWAEGLIQVVGTDWAAYSQTGWGDSVASIQAHAPTHEWPTFAPGSDPVNVYMRALTPLRTQVVGSGSNSVYVTPYEYDHTGTNTQWPGVPAVDFSAKPPTGSMLYMGVYLNPSTNALGVVSGSTTVFTDALEPAIPNWPLGVYPSGYVRLYGGQAGITERDIRPAQRIYNSTLMFTGTSGGGGWSFAHILTVSATDPDAQYATIALAHTAASAGDVILVDAETISGSGTITLSKAITLASLGGTVITSSVAGPTIEITAAGVKLYNLTIRNTGAGAKSGCVKWAVDDVVIQDCVLEKLSGASTVGYALWQAGGFNARIIDTFGECTDPSGSNYGYLNDTADCGVTFVRGQMSGLTSDIFTARASSNLIGEFFTVNGISWAGTSNGYYFDSGNLIALGGSGLSLVNLVNEISTDGTLAGNSDLAIPTEKAVKTYVDASRYAVKNLLYHSLTHDIWQEGTTFNDIADDTYVADVWNVLQNGQAPDVSGQAGVSTDLFTRYFRCTFDSASSQCGIVQFLEAQDTVPLRGQVVSISADLWGTNVSHMRMAVIEWGGTLDTLTSDVVGTWSTGNPTLATDWTYIGTPADITITSTRTRYEVENITISIGTSNLALFIWTPDSEASGDLFNVADVQLERGPVATEFVARIFSDEQARIRRFVQVMDATLNSMGQGLGAKTGTTTIDISFPLVPSMRIAPTMTNNVSAYGGGGPTTTTISIFDFAAGAIYTLTGSLTVGTNGTNKNFVIMRFTAGTNWNGNLGDLSALRIGPSVIIVFSARL